ncbi:hypothetical protein TELCIR_11844 [Teladorsagia circumcincta]|uniref:Uncharacterized protein n=1 Tax=Teladorsagia circumcincta TaxID=45464 RepID=A0A2G9U8A8_TELCI|nr:hypothetical protein TELCIR_11844 [Teladorsagia circumcincta]
MLIAFIRFPVTKSGAFTLGTAHLSSRPATGVGFASARMSLVVRILCFLLMVNVALCRYHWFEMPGTQKFNDGSDIPYEDEPMQMQKRFRVKYIRELGRLPGPPLK